MKRTGKAITEWREDEQGELIPVYSEEEFEPMVGIFFFVDDEIIIDSVPVEDGEPYGEAIQYGGHYEFWEMLAPRTLSERRFKARAYDAYPRGRVVFFPDRKKYVLYGDRCISTDDYGIIAEKFGLDLVLTEGYEINIEHDLHYKCSRCNDSFLD
jgi:hypothetical protein